MIGMIEDVFSSLKYMHEKRQMFTSHSTLMCNAQMLYLKASQRQREYVDDDSKWLQSHI